MDPVYFRALLDWRGVLLRCAAAGHLEEERLFALWSFFGGDPRADLTHPIDDPERWHDIDECCQCPRCEEWHSRDEGFLEMTSPRGESWCEECFEADGLTCYCGCARAPEDHEQWIAIEGEAYWGPSHHSYYWESDGEYHHEPPEDEEDEEHEPPDDEEDEDEDDGYVPGYHARSRPWSSRQEHEVYGVELETYCNDAYDVYIQLPEGWLGERDGSLDCAHGLEIIGPPLPLEQYAESPWKRIVTLPNRAWSAGKLYGMHVSVNRKAFLDEDHENAFIRLIHGNKAWCEKIAGRKESHYAKYTDRHGERVFNSDRYQAVNREEYRLEVRIFRATLKWTSFLKNVQFCASVFRYTKNLEAYADPRLSTYQAYLLENRGQFPELVDWLLQKKMLHLTPMEIPSMF